MENVSHICGEVYSFGWKMDSLCMVIVVYITQLIQQKSMGRLQDEKPRLLPSLKRSQRVETPENGWLEDEFPFWGQAYF